MSKIKIILIAFSLILLFSCQEGKQDKKKVRETKKETQNSQKQKKIHNIDAFWELFQKTISKNNLDSLKAISALDKGTGLHGFFEDHHENVITKALQDEVAVTFASSLKKGREPLTKTLSYIFKYPVNLKDEAGTPYQADLTFYFAVHKGKWKIISIIIAR